MLQYISTKKNKIFLTITAILFLYISFDDSTYLANILFSYLIVILLALPIFSKKIMKITENYNDVKLFLKIATLFLVIKYFYWRTMNSIVYEGFLDFMGTFLLYVAEIQTIIVFLLGLFTSLYILERKEKTIKDIPLNKLPTIDVYIPTYNEPLDITENTILSALNMKYPRELLNIYLCDDGGTEQKRNDTNKEKAKEAQERYEILNEFCRKTGAIYKTRAKNEHAKAGNINSAFQTSNGDLIVILDCDHIPSKDFLYNTVAYFIEDEKVFLVQTPHAFYNPDPIERNLDLHGKVHSENEMFYYMIQRGNDFWESSFFCGSAAILRRKYLEEVGGIAGQTITEDAETALELHSRGYKSIFVSKPMVRGLQPESFSGLVLQRVRWTQGMVQIFLLKNPMFKKGLSWHQRMSYIGAIFFWFFAISRITFMIAPLLFIFFGLKIYKANSIEIFTFVVPFILATQMLSYIIYKNVRGAFFSELYETVLSFFTFPALIEVLAKPRHPNFKVTPKGENFDKDFISHLSWPFFIMINLVGAGFFFGIYQIIVHPEQLSFLIITLAWNVMNFVMLLAALAATSEKKQLRKEVRVSSKDRATININNIDYEVKITDISLGGMKIEFNDIDKETIFNLNLEKGLCFKIKVYEENTSSLNNYDIIEMEGRYYKPLGYGRYMVFQFDNVEENLKLRTDILSIIFGSSAKWIELDSSKRSNGIINGIFFLIKQSLNNIMFKEMILYYFNMYKVKFNFNKNKIN